MTQSLRNALTALGIAAAVGATALPLLPVWLHHEPQQSNEIPITTFGREAFIGPITFAPIVVDLADGLSDTEVKALAKEYGLELIPNSIEAKDNRVFRASVGIDTVPQATDVNALLTRLRADRRVEAAEPEITFHLEQTETPIVLDATTGETLTIKVQAADPTVPKGTELTFSSVPSQPVAVRPLGTKPNDPLYSKQWNFPMIGAEKAWERTRGKGAVVAVIDTGVTKARDFQQTTFTEGYDFVNDKQNADDDHGHGTHVAGTIAESTNNNEGAAGIAFEATIQPLKVLSAEGSGTSADIADAIRWAADHGANVINMSLGSPYPSDVIHKACQYARKKGVAIVCAAGNSFREGVGYPAAFPECIAVSSVGPDGSLAKYSSWGKQVAIAAPGGDMIDSKDEKDGILQNSVLGGRDDYYAFQGTSMASPHVAGAAALLVSQGIKDPAKIKDLLQKTAVKPKKGYDAKKYGAGILNIANATAKAESEGGWKLRNTLVLAFAGLLLGVGGPLRRRNLLLRAGMAGVIALGFFGPDLWTRFVGLDSAWNLLSFSALLPAVAIAALRNGPGLKLGAAYAIGVGVNLFASWHNLTIPFTYATFGDSALPWTLSNMALVLTLAMGAAWRAAKHLR